MAMADCPAQACVSREHLAARIAGRLRDVTVFHVAKQHPLLPTESEVYYALAESAVVAINALGE